jgi:hypothetical protein
VKIRTIGIVVFTVFFALCVGSPLYAGPGHVGPHHGHGHEVWYDGYHVDHDDYIEGTVVREVIRGLVRVLTESDRRETRNIVIVDDSSDRVVEDGSKVVVLVADNDLRIDVDDGIRVIDIDKGTKVEVEEGTPVITANGDRDIDIDRGATLLVTSEYPKIIRKAHTRTVKVFSTAGPTYVVHKPAARVRVYRCRPEVVIVHSHP